jgi:riboflavin kinase/FMN adenylyltransferase
MEFYPGLDAVPPGFGPSAVTIGKFDGVHLGHQRVLAELRSVAVERGLVSTVVTFDRNPKLVLHPEGANTALSSAVLSSTAQKRELLESSGVDATVMVPFTTEFSLLEPEQFVDSVLVDSLNTRVVLVGSDFRFGHEGRGDVALLSALGRGRGYEVLSIDTVLADADSAVSSTLVRGLLAEGRVHEAAEILGRAPSVRGVVVRGQRRGHELGYPTANLSPDLEGLVPADGVYAARLMLDGRAMPAAVSIGNNPTFDGVPDKQVEAHVLDETLDLYDRVVTVEFVEYVRSMTKFSDVDALVTQMNADEREIRRILGVTA